MAQKKPDENAWKEKWVMVAPAIVMHHLISKDTCEFQNVSCFNSSFYIFHRNLIVYSNYIYVGKGILGNVVWPLLDS